MTSKSSSALLLLLTLAGCGGSSTTDEQSGKFLANIISNNSDASADSAGSATATTSSASRTVMHAGIESVPVSKAEASRFLSQASFGPTPYLIGVVAASGKAAWIESQFAEGRTPHLNYVRQIGSQLSAGTKVDQVQVFESFWQQAVNGQDHLRQRITFALSQIFVVSMVDGNVVSHPAGMANYYDTLSRHAFGNFRDLLQAVASHPMMGTYLTYLHNKKEEGDRLPDENFARELMQLMTIGLYQLNPDGTPKLQNGKPVETYTHDDVAGMAKVFTGWSWSGPDQSLQRFYGNVVDPEREWTPMQNYPQYHSTSSKTFLGTTISGATSGAADMKVALDVLFNHPNVGPFIGRQMIQRLVSSNPSPAYVGRVAAVFANNGAGVRGDMRAVIRAVLLDSEAADNGSAKKLREPVLRLANWMRAFNAKSSSGRFLIGSLDDPISALAQTPMRSPSVFNFFRPGYMPPNTALSAAGMVAPEMQLTGEPSVVGYLNFMQTAVPFGIGTNNDVKADYTWQIGVANQPEVLVDHVGLMLLSGRMSSTLRSQVLGAVKSVSQPTGVNATPADQAQAARNRVYTAIYLTMASPEYLSQR